MVIFLNRLVSDPVQADQEFARRVHALETNRPLLYILDIVNACRTTFHFNYTVVP